MNRLALWWRILTGSELQTARVELFEALEKRETATGNHEAAQVWARKAASCGGPVVRNHAKKRSR